MWEGGLPNSTLKLHRLLCGHHYVIEERGGGMGESKTNASTSGREPEPGERSGAAAQPLSSCGMWSTSLSEGGPMSTVDPNSWLSYAPAEF